MAWNSWGQGEKRHSLVIWFQNTPPPLLNTKETSQVRDLIYRKVPLSLVQNSPLRETTELVLLHPYCSLPSEISWYTSHSMAMISEELWLTEVRFTLIELPQSRPDGHRQHLSKVSCTTTHCTESWNSRAGRNQLLSASSGLGSFLFLAGFSTTPPSPAGQTASAPRKFRL